MRCAPYHLRHIDRIGIIPAREPVKVAKEMTGLTRVQP
jgi:hypothetical protein